jgi:S1-C subfamily serine protease
MPFDFTTAMIQATSPVASAPGGPALTGTGILVSDPAPDGTPRVVLVTARHVLANIPGGQVYLGLHLKNPDGSWRLEWRLEISVDQGRTLWVQHPRYDVAVLPVTVPPEVAQTAIPVSWFADSDTLAREEVEAGDPVELLGYPAGYAADARGFAILRLGHLSSYPMTPETEGTFLIDSPVVAGNSGGPVFTSRRIGRRPPVVGAQGPQPDEFIAGVIAQQIAPGGQSIQLGVAVHAVYVRQTLQLLDLPIAQPPPLATSTTPAPGP